MQDLLTIKMTSTVQEYYDRFVLAMHKVLVHNNHLDDVFFVSKFLFFVSKFLQGLTDDIRSAIVLHQPRTVDLALALALLQENVVEAQPKPFHKRAYKDNSKYSGKQPMVPQPGVLGTTPAEPKPQWEDKLATLRAQRRAQGLCMRCGEKWNRNHKCPEKISLHVLEEVLDILPTTTNSSDASSDSGGDSSDGEVFALSHCANIGIQGKKTIRLAGKVQDRDILILIDSGSTGTFLSESTAALLKCPVQTVAPIQVTVANGDKVTSTQQVSQFTWWTQGHVFSTDVRILPLPFYDMVLGMDWLETHSPMWIHWRRKLLRFSHQGSRISLKGVKDNLSTCPKIKARKVKGLLRKGGLAQLIYLSNNEQHTISDEVPKAVQNLV